MWLNCHSAVQKCLRLFIENGPWQFGQSFQNKNIFIFECEWPNGNSNDLCTLNGLSAVHTQTQTQTGTEEYRMHIQIENKQKKNNPKFWFCIAQGDETQTDKSRVESRAQLSRFLQVNFDDI